MILALGVRPPALKSLEIEAEDMAGSLEPAKAMGPSFREKVRVGGERVRFEMKGVLGL